MNLKTVFLGSKKEQR